MNNFYYYLNVFSAPFILALLKNNVLEYGGFKKKGSERYRYMKLANQQYQSKDLVIDFFFICRECLQLLGGRQNAKSMKLHDDYHTQIANPKSNPPKKRKMHL